MLQVKDKGLRELLLLILKQTLSNTQKVRMIEGALLDTFIFPQSHKLVQKMQEEQEAFVYCVDEYRKEKEKNPMAEPLGPPHALLFAALVETAATIDACGGDNLKKIKQLSDDINVCEKQEDVEQLVRVCRLQKTAQEDHMKIVLAIQNLGDRRFGLIDGLRQCGGRHLRGSAPAGYMEEELQEWTEWMEASVSSSSQAHPHRPPLG